MLLLNTGDDSIEDVLVLASELGAAAEQRCWLALDGATGRELWRYRLPVGQKHSPLAVMTDSLLLLTSDTQLTALDPFSARVVWRQPLKGAVESLCATEAYVAVRYSETAQQHKSPGLEAFTTTSGTAVLARSAKSCTPAYSTRSAGPNFSYVEGSALRAWLPKTHNFHVQRGLLPNQGSARVVLGTGPLRAVPSASGPAALGVIANRRWLWQGLVAAESAGVPRLLDPPQAAVRQERIVVPHLLMGDPALRVASFELANGRWQWERRLEHLPDAFASKASGTALAISRTGQIFVRTPTGRLFALDLESGAVRWQLEP
jgi:outer membrane protein assembly factor BamB